MVSQLSDRHVSSADKERTGMLASHRTIGIPHAVMSYAIFQFVRGAEYIAEKEGAVLTNDDKGSHYNHFALLAFFAGLRVPPNRAAMERVCIAMDALAERSPLVDELLLRTMRIYDQHKEGEDLSFNARADYKLTEADFLEFLYPKSSEVLYSLLQKGMLS